MAKVRNRQQRKFFKNENIEFPKTVTLTHPKISVEGNQFCFQWRTFACCVIHNWEFHTKKKERKRLRLIQTLVFSTFRKKEGVTFYKP